MNLRLLTFSLLSLGLLSSTALANSATEPVPEPFLGFDANSRLVIDYTDFDSLLDMVVLQTGRSTREKADPTHARTGTRMKTKVNKATINEGNRFYYEIFENNEQNQQTLLNIRKRLENIPLSVPLDKFSRDEQLAYWLNLYNITILGEIAAVYPKNDLKKMLVGKKSILSEKLLTVAGIPLSLADIQFTILKHNYASNPLIIYGLYQGNIGGPNIRKHAYTGKHVYADLIDNAMEFINSNRGTESKNDRVFQVSSLYARNRGFFADFEPDLRAHLLDYLEGEQHQQLRVADTIEADINDWTITDLYGSQREVGGSLTHSNAAMMGAVSGPGTAMTNNTAAAASGRYSPAVVERLNKLNRTQGDEPGSGAEPAESEDTKKRSTESDKPDQKSAGAQ